MLSRLFFPSTILLACSLVQAGETYFEVLDHEGQALFGTLVQFDHSQITVNAQGEIQTLPITSIVKIRNLASNPYQATSAGNQRPLQPPVLPRAANFETARQNTNVQNANAQKLINLLAKIQQTNEQAVAKTFPDSVTVLELTDGSRLTATSFNLTAGQAGIRLLEPQSSSRTNDLTLPLDALSAVRFSVRSLPDVLNPPEDWRRLAVPSTEGDKLIVGQPGSFDVYTGILGEVSGETVFFNVDGDILPIPRHRVYGLVFHGGNNSPVQTAMPPIATLTFWSGTQGLVSSIALENTELTWQTASGLTASVPLDDVSEIDFGGTGLASLFDFERVRSEFTLPFASDMQPEGLLQTFLESRTQVSREIVLDGTAYEQGITLKGRATLSYRLPKQYTSLQAVIGIEDQFRPHASAVLHLLADSQVLGTWELRGDAASQRISVNLPPDCRMITIVAEPLFQPDTSTILTLAELKVAE